MTSHRGPWWLEFMEENITQQHQQQTLDVI
jgi:hypothetical protein